MDDFIRHGYLYLAGAVLVGVISIIVIIVNVVKLVKTKKKDRSASIKKYIIGIVVSNIVGNTGVVALYFCYLGYAIMYSM